MLKRVLYIFKQRIYELLNRNKPCQGKVYMFHDVSDNKGLYSIAKESFEEFINWLLINKKIVTIEELKKDLNNDNVVITFDDIYASVYQNAFEYLKEKNIPYYIFVCEELIGKNEFATKEMILEMINNSNCVLGCHRKKHELSRNVNDSDLELELNEIKEKYQETFNTKIDNFAFPYGSMFACSNNNIEVSKKIFSNVFMTYRLSYNHKYNNVIPRININGWNYKEEMK